MKNPAVTASLKRRSIIGQRYIRDRSDIQLLKLLKRLKELVSFRLRTNHSCVKSIVIAKIHSKQRPIRLIEVLMDPKISERKTFSILREDRKKFVGEIDEKIEVADVIDKGEEEDKNEEDDEEEDEVRYVILLDGEDDEYPNDDEGYLSDSEEEDDEYSSDSEEEDVGYFSDLDEEEGLDHGFVNYLVY